MAALGDQMPGAAVEDRREAATGEVGAALHLTRESADIEMSLALDLAGRLPRVAELFGGAGDRPAPRPHPGHISYWIDTGRTTSCGLALLFLATVFGIGAMAWFVPIAAGGPSEEQMGEIRGQAGLALGVMAGGALLDASARLLLWGGGRKRDAYIRLRRLHPNFVAAIAEQREGLA